MNRDMSVITRALIFAGQEPLTDEEVKTDNVRWRTVKALYLPAYLSVTASAEWTELKHRAVLKKAEGRKNHTSRTFLYELPIDCARAIELLSDMPYEIEGNYLATDDQEAVLLFVSNGFHTQLARQEEKTDKRGKKYGDAYHRGKRYDMRLTKQGVIWTDESEDYPDYLTLPLSPEFTECLTMTLAAELSLKITGNMQLYGICMQLAAAAKGASEKISRAKGASRTSAQEFWGDRLGIPSRGRS